jgi:hypothetical protein
MSKALDSAKFTIISVILFVATLVTSEGWVRAVAVVWLVYPAFVARRLVRSSRDQEDVEHL